VSHYFEARFPVSNQPVANDPAPERERFEGVRRIVRGIIDADAAEVERATVEVSERSRWLAPLAFVAGAIALTVLGIKPLLVNWRLTLIELVPAAWLWMMMFNLRHHVVDGTQVHALHPLWWILVGAAFVGLAMAAFFCNAIFAVALGTGDKHIRPAVRIAWSHWRLLLMWSLIIGVGHAVSVIWIARISPNAYAVAQTIVLAVALVTFISVPASIAGVRRRSATRRDRVAKAAVGSTMSAVVSLPGFILDRVGLILLTVQNWHWLGFVCLSIGVAMQLAATTSTRAVKLSTVLVNSDASAAPSTE
jgi:hypothetical protein